MSFYQRVNEERNMNPKVSKTPRPGQEVTQSALDKMKANVATEGTGIAMHTNRVSEMPRPGQEVTQSARQKKGQ